MDPEAIEIALDWNNVDPEVPNQEARDESNREATDQSNREAPNQEARDESNQEATDQEATDQSKSILKPWIQKLLRLPWTGIM